MQTKSPSVLSLPDATSHVEKSNLFSRVSLAQLAVLGAVLFNLVTLRKERLVVFYPNDNGLHLQMTSFAGALLHNLQSPFDHWYPFLSLGSPFFVDYQSFSAALIGAIGNFFNTPQAFAWSMYLLLALWPLCVYWSTRLMGWSSSIAAAAGVFAPLLFSITGHGFEYKSYLWVGNGLWSQLWAMWTLPLAWGFCWRYLESRRHYVPAMLSVALTIVFHFLTAFMVVGALGVWVIVSTSRFRERLIRASLIGAGALGTTLWITVPLLSQGQWLAVNQFQVGTTINNSYGGGQALSWLFHGDLYDSGRLPIITLLAAIGMVYCLANRRKDPRARALIALWVLSMIFFSGRPTFSFLLDLIPGNQGILFQRYIAEVQLTGIVLAGVGVVSLWGSLVREVPKRWPITKEILALRGTQRRVAMVLVVVLATIGLSPAWHESQAYAHRSAYWIALQQRADASDGTSVRSLVRLAELHGGGRIYAGMPSNWGHRFHVGDVPVYIYLEQLNVDAVGFTLRTSGTMTDPEAYFNQYNPGDYVAFGVHYLLLPSNYKPPVPATLEATSGHYRLWSVATSGLFHVIQTQGVIHANASTIGYNTSHFLSSVAIERGVYPEMAYGTQPAALPTLPAGAPTTSRGSGHVVREVDNLTQGTARAVVEVQRTSVVLLAASYEPGWSVTLDGFAAPTQMVAPALLGVQVGRGLHTIVFTYHGYRHYGLLFSASGATVIAAAILAWRSRRSPLAVRYVGKRFNPLPAERSPA